MNVTLNRRALILLAAGGSFALLAGAFVFQSLGYAPCKMCLWQRWPHGAAIVLGAIGAFAPLAVVALAGAAAAALTGAIGVYHAGVEWKLWEGPTTCTGGGPVDPTAPLSGSDLLSLDGPVSIVMCDEIVWSLFGLSMAGWNAVLSFGLAALWLAAWRRGA